MVYLAFFAIPLLIALAAFVFTKQRISFKELLAQLAVQAVLVGIICSVAYYRNTWDVEIQNGRVSDKKKVWVSCSHSYSCNCREVCSGSGKDQSCSTVCDTCYEHSNDWDWEVYTTNRETIDIDRVDRRGSNEPPRWTAVRIGEPTSIAHSYENIIKAVPDSLFRTQGNEQVSAPEYPGNVYDYYRLNRLVQQGTNVADAGAWNNDLAEINADLGQRKQVNMVVVLAKNQSREWFKHLERNWIGGKKNDTVLVVNVDNTDKITWAETMAWTDHSIFKVRLRDEVLNIGTLDRSKILKTMATVVEKDYRRKPMSDYNYLRAAIVPTTTQFVVGIIIATLAALGLSLYFHENDPFGDEIRRWNPYSYR